MRFKKVSEDKLQIIMNKEDLKARNLAKWDILPHNINAQKIFQDILEEAYQACGFVVENNTQLIIEAFPITGESLLINVTKVNTAAVRNLLEDELAGLGAKFFGDVREKDDAEDEIEIDGDEVYCFQTLDDAIELSVLLEGKYLGESSLYKYDELYFLQLRQEEELTFDGKSVLQEYSVKIELAVEFLQEHGQSIISEQALERLRLVG